jgi:proteasome lid subunit RPN8/RPN11
MTQVKSQAKGLDLRMCCEAARQIRQHARSSMKTEVCGVLVGSEKDGITSVEASIQGANSVQAGTHVTFTQDTWEHIYHIKDRDYPDARIVGWYHSHPGFGVFLSDHDSFIHKNFFSAAQQVAWVYDPHSDEEGCFGWVDGDLKRLSRIVFVDDKGGEVAGETGKKEPLIFENGNDDPHSIQNLAPLVPPTEGQAALQTGMTILSYICVLALGFLLCWFLFPRFILVSIDPKTGQPVIGEPMPSVIGGPNAGQTGSQKDHSAPAPSPINPASPPQGAKGKP